MTPSSLLIFRRDLRLDDNTALLAARSRSRSIIPCFVFTDAQTVPHRFRSVNGLAFMLESLSELREEIARDGGWLHLFHGEPHEVVAALAERGVIDGVYVNKDYTPYSRERDRQIAASCEAAGIGFHSFSDALLVEPSVFAKPDRTPYTVFTPFYKRAVREEVRRAIPFEAGCPWGRVPDGVLAEGVAAGQFATTSPERYCELVREVGGGAPQRRSLGGRRAAVATLARVPLFSDYATVRDLPALDKTSILSPHNKFGTVSIREVYWTAADSLGIEHPFIRELFWRDFFTHIAWHFPHVFSGSFHRRFDRIPWEEDSEKVARWSAGMTGYPIVDAGMRELQATGYMHNRVRMIVASFLTKDLHQSWRMGEAVFAQHLTEYDPAVNNGSWQWAASTGCDAQPYFRIFNPWLQQKKFDSDAVYIKRWVPEFSGWSAAAIHRLEDQGASRPRGYPGLIVDHAEAKGYAVQLFRGLAEDS